MKTKCREVTATYDGPSMKISRWACTQEEGHAGKCYERATPSRISQRRVGVVLHRWEVAGG